MKPARRRLWAAFLVILACVSGFGPAAQAEDDQVMVSSYRKAIEVDPQDVLAHFNLGLALYKLDRFDEARDTLTRCLAVNRRDERAHLQVDGPVHQLLGIMYLNHFQDNPQAVASFLNSQKFLPDDPDTHYALSMAYFRMQDYAKALKSLEMAGQAGHVRDAEFFFQKALMLTELRRETEAVAAYREALQRKPDFTAALENLALVYHNQGQDDATIEVLNQLIKLDPMNFNANYLLGLHYYRKKMYTEMVAAYNRAVAVKPDLAEAHYNLGMAYYYQNRFELAVDELKKAVTLNPQDAEAYNLLGQAQSAAVETYLHQGGTYLAQENYNEAVTALQKVYAVDPNNARAKELMEEAQRRAREAFASHLRLGDKFLQEHKLEEAYNEYELASRLNAASPEVREGMHKAGAQMGQLLAQRMQRAKGAEAQKDYHEAYVQYTSALELKSDYAPAQKALEALRAQVRQEAQHLFKVAESDERERLPEAIAAYKRILKISEVLQDDALQARALTGLTRANVLRADHLAQTLAQAKKVFAAGNDAKARELFNKVLKWDPQNKTANEYIVKMTGAQSQAKVTDEQIKTTYYQGVDSYIKGNIEAAISAWEKVLVLDPDYQDAKTNIARAKAKLDAIRKLTEGN